MQLKWNQLIAIIYKIIIIAGMYQKKHMQWSLHVTVTIVALQSVNCVTQFICQSPRHDLSAPLSAPLPPYNPSHMLSACLYLCVYVCVSALVPSHLLPATITLLSLFNKPIATHRVSVKGIGLIAEAEVVHFVRSQEFFTAVTKESRCACYDSRHDTSVTTTTGGGRVLFLIIRARARLIIVLLHIFCNKVNNVRRDEEKLV